MRRYATFTSFTGYDPAEEKRIKKVFKKIFKTDKIRVSFNERELVYYVVVVGGVYANETV